MLALFIFVVLMALFMGAIAVSPETDTTNRSIAIFILISFLPWLVVLAIGLRRAVLGRWMTNRRWHEHRRDLDAMGFRDATTPEVLETGRLPAHILSPEVLAPKRGGGIDHVSIGSVNGDEVRAFNVRVRGGGWCDVPAVALRLPVSMAATMIRPVKGRLRMPPRPGMRSVSFESESFNRSTAVFSRGPYFASAMVDARMMSWLMEQGERCVIELSDRWAFAWALPRRGRHLGPVDLIQLLSDFDDHVPQVLPSLFPASDRRLLWRAPKPVA
jgi:hypothetical protein